MQAARARPPAGKLRLMLVGFGSVGQELARLLLQAGDPPEYAGVEFSVVAIATGSHGAVVDVEGIDLRWALDVLGQNGSAVRNSLGPARNTPDLIEAVDADVVLELTPLSMEGGEPAVSHVAAALKNGKHVVTANKGPIAFAYRRLRDLAREHDRQLLFEATVMDGTPVFNLVRHGLLGARVTGFRGILNSTTNFVLEQVEKGQTLAEAVEEAQERGFAEADPTLDLNGWDAAAKTAVLANTLLGADITPQEVDRTGIQGIGAAQLQNAKGSGSTIKLICEACTATDDEGLLAARVAPQKVALSSPFAQVSGTSSLLMLTTDLMGSITVIEHDPQLTQTAYGVLNDLLELAKATVDQEG